MRTLRTIAVLTMLGVLLFGNLGAAFAADTGTLPGNTPSVSNSNNDIKLVNPLGENKTLIDILKSIFKTLQYIMFAVVPIFVVVGAFQMIFAAGNPEKFATGQKTIVYAVIGLIIVMVANGLVAIVKSILTV